MLKGVKTGFFVGMTLMAASQVAVAGGKWQATYEVSITNITPGQTFTPQLVTTHSRQLALYTLGAPASDELATLAESGNTAPMTELLLSTGNLVGEAKTIGGLLGPGETATVQVKATRRTKRLSIGAMLIPTNDTFVGADSLNLPRWGSKTYYLQAFDAGTEFNDQNCANIPGPRCGGEPDSAPADTDEGFVHVSNGFHELGLSDDEGNEILGPATYSWLNPVAKVVVTRVK